MDTLRANEIFNDSRFKVIIVESVSLNHNKANTSCLLNGKIKPIAVIICGPDRIYALDMDAKLINLEQLRQNISELDNFITPLKKSIEFDVIIH